MGTHVEASYSRRAEEYTQRLGSLSVAHASDVQLITSWAEGVDGPLLDAGCGPGQWTGYLAERGLDARGIDQVREFIEHARVTHPRARFDVGSIDALPDSAGSLAGVLAWYSLIHHEPASIRQPLAEFARVLRPGGELLVGFFTGPDVEPFDHAIATAYRWPPEALAAVLREAGFEVIETHTRTAATSTPRPHGAMLARLSREQ
ncbi:MULTISPECIES: class I SAM-dependent methyltransferase [unclassified Frondihabitans]|uniref:class I SAM-dependent methyltransferase n=1 Tax=unclassified Frondihabitans TaxID=2626248 RepID=UPI000F4DD408|nr:MULTISPECIES: class I SAM-dependent methyltransferase [unclassified Frondihabitans]RPE78087.1 ubiquinone/menaquinone biosynthesis C-methylase UbiE [Frondihabitans sp. PhB153]RPF08367.1 ubiquinone/menaquinone biosynthesis C-methylase UbiE [Frondihabitans sp. PhB161]